MASIQLSKEAKLINGLVHRIGCITVSQAVEILTSTTPVKEKTANTIITILGTKQCVRIVDKKYLVPFVNGKVSRKSIECMWYIMSKLETLSEYENIFDSAPPADLFFMGKDSQSYELIHVSEKNLGVVNVIIKKYLEATDREKTYSYNNIFLFDASVDEDKILITFSEKELTIPHSIVFLKYSNICVKPQIIEYGSSIVCG